MAISFVLNLLVILSGPISIQSAGKVVGSVEPSPLSIEDDSAFENITYFYDNFGYLHKIDINRVKDEVTTVNFSPEEGVIFELYTLKNPREPQILTDYVSILNSNFNPLRPTRIFIHGWKSRLNSEFTEGYFDEAKYDANLIAVNWGTGADTYFYHLARGRVNLVGEHVARFVDFMYENGFLTMENLNIIGHSLGAHVGGIAGKKITSGIVNKIIGLDPALPLFSYEDLENRLTDTDADYVEVIHSCAGKLGYKKPIGHADFYPNSGYYQPGCGHDLVGSCSHARAVDYYLESVKIAHFYAYECDTLENILNNNCNVVSRIVQMGGEPGFEKVNGLFYLETNEKRLFGRGTESLLRKKRQLN